MRRLFYIIAFLLICFSTQSPEAEDIIKVLIIGDLDAPLPREKAKKIGHLTGDILINDHIYNGFIMIRKDENGLHFINELPFEQYIEGVVAAETGEQWALEALKAQAVISRTYALFQKNRNSDKNYHITSSVLHQVYKGNNTDEFISRAVKETRGEILTYQGVPIEAFYHSTCGGKTELPDAVWGKSYPYLKSVPCRGEHSPYEHWQRRFRIDEIEERLGLNDIRDMFTISFTSTGRVDLLKVVTGESEIEIKATDLRRLLGYKELPSTYFSITMDDENIIFEGGGYGHGVGLSQWGALELANEGKSYRDILLFYYPGTVLRSKDKLSYQTLNTEN